jgi:hypothetical protein
MKFSNIAMKWRTSQHMKKKFLIVVVLILLVLMAFIFRFDRFGFVEVDFMDCVYMNNQLYFSGAEGNGGERTLVDPALIDKKIGDVKFTLSENVHSTYYINRNVDAAFLDVGTEIYSMKAGENSIAIKIGGQYFEFKAK